MQIRTILILLAGAFLLSLSPRAFASGVPTITLKATRSAILNDGKDFTEIIAEVRDGTGSYVPDGTQVTFQISSGQFRGPSTVGTRAGTARIRVSGQQKGTATLSATVLGGGFQQLPILFTDDPEETFQGNAFMDVQSTSLLVYAAVERIIEAKGRLRKEGDTGLPGASVSYRNVQVFADSLQLDCTANAVRATGNVRLVKGGKQLKCVRLFFPLAGGDGYAIIEAERRLAPVKVKGGDLSTEAAESGIPPRYFEMTDLTGSPLIVSARQIRLFPGEKLQFKRPRFYQEGQQILAMEFYSLGLYSSQLFTDQFLNVGSQGIGVDFPFYYDLSPASTGILHVRHGERQGRSLYATRPGLSLDLTQGYNSFGGSRRFTGEVGLTGLNRSDWGFRWNHNQEFANETLGSFFLDIPQHRSLFASTNLSHQWGPLRLGMNLSANRSLSGISTRGTQSDFYVETNPRKFGSTGYMMALGGSVNFLRNQTEGFKNSAETQTVQARFYSNPFRLDSRTSLTNYITVGNIWSNQGQGGASVISSLTANRSFSRNATLQMTYDFTQQPNYFTDGGKHRLSATLMMNGGEKWNLFLYNTTMVDAKNSSLIGDFNYQIAPRWRLNLAATMQTFSTASYRDFTLGIGRSIGGRDILFSYSTFSHKFLLDLTASRF